MPDHEEAVREARREVEAVDQFFREDIAPLSEQDAWPALDAFESAIRASERAKYAALVEALQVIVIETNSTMNTYSNTGGTVDPGKRANGLARAALAALQSKEGTNE